MKAIFSSEFATADDIFAQQIDVLGASSLPSEWWEAWEQRSQFFSPSSDQMTKVPKESRYVWPPLDEAFEEGVQKYRRRSKKVESLMKRKWLPFLSLCVECWYFDRKIDLLHKKSCNRDGWLSGRCLSSTKL